MGRRARLGPASSSGTAGRVRRLPFHPPSLLPPTPVCSTSLGQPQPRFQLHPHQPSKQKLKKLFCPQKLSHPKNGAVWVGWICRWFRVVLPLLPTSQLHLATQLQLYNILETFSWRNLKSQFLNIDFSPG